MASCDGVGMVVGVTIMFALGGFTFFHTSGGDVQFATCPERSLVSEMFVDDLSLKGQGKCMNR